MAWLSPRGWTVAGVLLVMAAALVSLGYERMAPVDDTPRGLKELAALMTCQKRISALSIGVKVPLPPAARNYGTPPDFYFVWPKGTFYYSDSEGVLNAAAATCRGDLATGLITELSLNGRDVTVAPRREDW